MALLFILCLGAPALLERGERQARMLSLLTFEDAVLFWLKNVRKTDLPYLLQRCAGERSLGGNLTDTCQYDLEETGLVLMEYLYFKLHFKSH